MCVIRVYALINWRKATRVTGEVSAAFLCCLDLSSEGVGKKAVSIMGGERVCVYFVYTCDEIVCTECSSALIAPRHDDNIVWVYA